LSLIRLFSLSEICEYSSGDFQNTVAHFCQKVSNEETNFLITLTPNVVHDFVLPLAWRLVAGKNDLAALPQSVGGDFARNEVLKLLVETVHETEK